MAHYAEHNHQNIPADQRSLTVAMCNLLETFGYTTTPDSLYKLFKADNLNLDWQLIPRYFDGLSLIDSSDSDVWPQIGPAIVKFQRIDKAAAGMVDHYCLVKNLHDGVIIDSLDGQEKHASIYGGVRGWAVYRHLAEDEKEDDADELDLAPERPGKRHKVIQGESVWTIARAHKITPTKLMDHNEITDGKSVRPGTWIYIPKPDKKERPEITYRLLEEPRPMHINHPAYTTKYSFGAVRTWNDIKAEKQQWADRHNVDIVAVAKVPVEDTVAAYYMDKHDLGNYATTGRVAYTRGFNWQHLAEGHVEQVKPLPTVAEIMADAMQEDDRPAMQEPVTDDTPDIPAVAAQDAPEAPDGGERDDEAVSPLERELDDYKTSFRYLNIEESPELFRLLQDIDIREFDGQSEPIHKREGSTVKVSGWFTHQGTPYLRVATRYWFGIPAHMAYSIEDDVFNEGIPKTVAERVASGGFLTDDERRLAAIARAAAKYQKLKRLPSLFRRK